MENQPNQHDAAIDKTLSALSHAAPPLGMEARIAARIAQRAEDNASAPEPAFGWRSLFAGSSLTGAWWRGALTGAAAAMLSVCALLLILHHPQTPQHVVQNAAAPHGALPAPAIPVAQVKPDTSKPAAVPCPPTPNIMQLRRHASTPRPALLRVATTERHPILAGPLTTQERGLLLLARTADPQQLAMLNSDAQAKAKAEDAAEFEKFFAPPPQPKMQQENE